MMYARLKGNYQSKLTAWQVEFIKLNAISEVPKLVVGEHFTSEIVIPYQAIEFLSEVCSLEMVFDGGGLKMPVEGRNKLEETDGIVFNPKVKAPVPDAALMGVKEVKVIEDCCTDRLQGELDSGWKILAICPQPQRRPDHVLGRGKKDEDDIPF